MIKGSIIYSMELIYVFDNKKNSNYRNKLVVKYFSADIFLFISNKSFVCRLLLRANVLEQSQKELFLQKAFQFAQKARSNRKMRGWFFWHLMQLHAQAIVIIPVRKHRFWRFISDRPESLVMTVCRIRNLLEIQLLALGENGVD